MRWNLQYIEFHTAMSCTMYRALQLTVEDFIQHTMLHSVFTVWIPHWTTLHLTEQISGKIVCECCTVCWTELHCVLHCTPRNCTLCCTYGSVEETVLQHKFAMEEEKRTLLVEISAASFCGRRQCVESIAGKNCPCLPFTASHN